MKRHEERGARVIFDLTKESMVVDCVIDQVGSFHGDEVKSLRKSVDGTEFRSLLSGSGIRFQKR